MAIAGQRVFDQDRIVPGGVQPPPRLVGDPHLREGSSGLKLEIADVHALPRAFRRPLVPRPG